MNVRNIWQINPNKNIKISVQNIMLTLNTMLVDDRTVYSCRSTTVFSRKIDGWGEGAGVTGIIGAILCTRPCVFTGFMNPFTFVVRRATIFEGADRMRLLCTEAGT